MNPSLSSFTLNTSHTTIQDLQAERNRLSPRFSEMKDLITIDYILSNIGEHVSWIKRKR